MALTSPPDARALFDTFVKQWKQCQGTTMVLYQAAGADNYADAPGGPVQMPPCALSGVQPGGPAGATRQLSGFFGEYTTGMSSPVLGQLSTSTANR